ncbi:MAG TPA: hypothetical protein DCE41_00340 [Cytophagales bacterium]|nr:hypothetical protein [Cytophagales bacterium]HAA22924.1 hypothetical protein [Cytophagales bacterium]HAP62579.1 hypothetical protein [Cytophagales bacterium]
MSIQNSIIKHLSQPPNLHYAEKIFSRQFGKEKAKAILDKSCHACNVSGKANSVSHLELLYKHLSTQEGKIGVYGYSLLVMLKSYTNLQVFSQTLSR